VETVSSPVPLAALVAVVLETTALLYQVDLVFLVRDLRVAMVPERSPHMAQAAVVALVQSDLILRQTVEQMEASGQAHTRHGARLLQQVKTYLEPTTTLAVVVAGRHLMQRLAPEGLAVEETAALQQMPLDLREWQILVVVVAAVEMLPLQLPVGQVGLVL
jgi:hypothetical protein